MPNSGGKAEQKWHDFYG